MPRATQQKITSQIKIEPYGKAIEGEPIMTPSPRAKSAPKGAYRYNKLHLVSLVITHTSPNWGEIASAIGKTETKCKDMWRKVIQPNLCNNKPWAGSTSGAWTKDEKIQMATMVLQSKPDWLLISQGFPGRTKTQVHDLWRKVIFPRLKRGETIE